MGIVLGIIGIIISVGIWFVIVFANGMSDNPSASINPWPIPLIILTISIVFIVTHWYPIHFHW